MTHQVFIEVQGIVDPIENVVVGVTLGWTLGSI